MITESKITFTFKMSMKVLLNTLFSSIKPTTLEFVAVLSRMKVFNFLTSILFSALITSKQIHQASVITIKNKTHLKHFLH